MPLGGEEIKEGVEERGIACEGRKLELCPLRKCRIETRRDSNVEDFQVMKSRYNTQYFRNVEFLESTQSIESQTQRGDEANIVDRIGGLVEDAFGTTGTEFSGKLGHVQRYPTTCAL